MRGIAVVGRLRRAVSRQNRGVTQASGQAEVREVDEVEVVGDHPAVPGQGRIQGRLVPDPISAAQVHVEPAEQRSASEGHRAGLDLQERLEGGMQPARAVRGVVLLPRFERGIGEVHIGRGGRLQIADGAEIAQVLDAEPQVQDRRRLHLDDGRGAGRGGAQSDEHPAVDEVVAQCEGLGTVEFVLIPEPQLGLQPGRIEPEDREIAQVQALLGQRGRWLRRRLRSGDRRLRRSRGRTGQQAGQEWPNDHRVHRVTMPSHRSARNAPGARQLAWSSRA